MKNKKMGKILFWMFLLGVFLAPGTIWARPNAYIVNRTDRTISVIDTANDTVITTKNSVGVGGIPTGIAISPNREKIYITDTGGNSIIVIDGNTYEYLTTINVGTATSGIVFNPAGTKVYVNNYGSNYVSVIDVATNTVERTITVGNSPVGMAINPAGTYLYVGNINSDTVSVINLANNSVSTLSTTIDGPTGIVFLPSGGKFYVAQQNGTDVYVFNALDNSFIKTISAEDCSGNVISNPAGTKVYVPSRTTSSVIVIDTATDTVEKTIQVGLLPFGISINPSGTKVYTANTLPKTVSVVDLATSQVSTVDVGAAPISFGNFIDPQSIVELSSSALNFDNTYIGKESTETLTITNKGTANLVLGNLTENSSNFKIQNDACSGQTLQLLGTCTAEIVFEPQKTSGTKSTSLTFTSNDPDQTTLTVLLSGKAKYAKEFVTKAAKSKQVLIKKKITGYTDGLYFRFEKYSSKFAKKKYYLEFAKVKKYPKNYVNAKNETLKKYWKLTNNFYKYKGAKKYKIKMTFKYTQKEFNKLKKKIKGLKKNNLTVKFRTKDNMNWQDLKTNWQGVKIDAKNKKIIVKYFSDFKEKIYYFTIAAK